MRDKIILKILAISFVVLMVISGTMTLIGSVSALDITDQFLEEHYGYIVNPHSVFIDTVDGDNDTALLGHWIVFNGTSYVEISGPGGTFFETGTSDLTGDGITDTWFDTSVMGVAGLYSVSDGTNTEMLTVNNPIMNLNLKIGNYSTTSVPRGTPLRIDFDTNLDYEDRVDLRIIDPDGIMLNINWSNEQRFGNINISQLLEYGSFDKSKQIDTSEWEMGSWTIYVKTDKENARGLSAASAEKTIEITHPEISIEASKTNPTINETVILTVQGVPYHNIRVESSCPSETVFEGGKYDYHGPDTSGPIYGVMDEDGVRHYAVHFTDAGTYEIEVEDLDEERDDDIHITVSQPEKLTLGIENGNKIRVNFDTYLLNDDRVDLKIMDSNGRLLHLNPTDSQVYYNLTVREVKGMVINTSGWNSGRYTVWIKTNKSYIPVLEVHSTPATFEIKGNGTVTITSTAFFFNYIPPFRKNFGLLPASGDNILIYGTTSGGNTIDIAINDTIVRTDTPIQNGYFVDMISMRDLNYSSTTLRHQEIKAFIDATFSIGENVSDIEDNGSSVFLRSWEPIVSLSGGTVVIGNDMVIHGTAVYGQTIDIAIEDVVVKTDVSIGEEGHFELILPTPETPFTDTEGSKRVKAFVDTSFALGENVTGIEEYGRSFVYLQRLPEANISISAGEINFAEELASILVYGVKHRNISIDSSNPTNTSFPGGLGDNPQQTPSLPFVDIIDRTGIMHYYAYFNKSETFTITVTDLETENSDSVNISHIGDVDEDNIYIFADRDTIVMSEKLRVKVIGARGHNITVNCSDPSHAEFPPGFENNPWTSSIPFNDRIKSDGDNYYVVVFNATGTYTVTITDTDTGNNDSVNLTVVKCSVVFDVPASVTIGGDLLIMGCVNAGDYVDIVMDDILIFNDEVIYIDGTFECRLDTTGMETGSHKIDAYIDCNVLTWEDVGTDVTDLIDDYNLTPDGSVTLRLVNPTLSAKLSRNEVTQISAFRIWGSAAGTDDVDVITLSPNGGNGTGLDGDVPLFPDTNVTGITYMVLSVSETNNGFTTRIDVDRSADEGTYKVIATVPGKNGTYDGLGGWWWRWGAGELLEGIIDIYCGGDPEVLASMTQKELVGMIKNATINASGSDDLLQELHLSVVERVTVFDTRAPANPYPSISGMHNGTITPFNDINVSKLYTYPCAGTGGHTEYVRIWNSTDWSVIATWDGYKGDWHNISFDAPFTLVAGETYNYTIHTGSYPQIHHKDVLPTANGWINCTSFVDTNGRVYYDGIPAIRLFL